MTARLLALLVAVLILLGLVLSGSAVTGLFPAGGRQVPPGELWELNPV